ncbi:hypothetical protein Tco_1085172 [Tanacetum coccineum]
MAISTISISSDSSEESVGTPSGRVFWFGRIPTTVPVTTPTIDPPIIHDDTSLIPTETPTISPITSTIPATAPTTHYTSPFIYTDSSDDDTPDTPPSPTHEIPPFEVVPPTSQILPAPFGVRRRRVTIVSPGQPIPYSRPYRYHPNGPVHMMTARKRVGPLPTHCLAVRHSVDYSSSDHITFDDSMRDSPSDSSSDSSSETSSDSSSDALSNSSSGHSSSDHSSPALPSGMRSSHQLCSSVPSIPHSSAAITERPSHSSSAALSSARADLLPPPKRIRISDSVMNLEVSSDESFELSVLRETSLRDDVDVGGSDEPHSEHDIDPKVQAEINECIAYADSLRAEGIDARVVVETVAREEVETSARGMVEVRVDRVTHHAVSDDILEPAQEEGAIEGTYETLGDLVQRFHDHTVEIPVYRVKVIESIQRDQGQRIVATGQQSVVLLERIRELETMPNTRSRATMTREAVNELIDRQLAEALETRDAARNLEPLVEGGNANGNGGGNGYGNHNMNPRGFMPVARECTYQDFLKCQPLNFNGTEGVVGLTRWFEKMETVFHISNCPQKYQVYCPRNKIKKMETEMVPDEEDKVERFIGGLPDNIQGNVIAAEPTRLQDAIRIANNLMDQKLKGYARSAENKRKFENNPRDRITT